ncbi:alpha/beta fold hydrolase [Arthrobacter sp. NEB 688]|uniref:alpha/beta hydrolase n=1 Tax=Arthrobacter sp. NEB 688 TaxID=904039 RepID=UPI00156783C1|nr:alpha/beta fold hydrolase [Arthrobacter sp. NEB 688]QKE82941.1 alpha/beta fold hydrolase [Arthrobacter sp. NEB 688]
MHERTVRGRSHPAARRRRKVVRRPRRPTVETLLLAPDGGGGARLHGRVPEHPRAVVVVLHGGRERSRERVGRYQLAVLRMLPFVGSLRRTLGEQVAVVRLTYRVRGWNGHAADPLVDTRWALERIRRVLPGVPVALVGHSMGGRVALTLAADSGVAAVAALAPWVEGDLRAPRDGRPVLLMHGTADRTTDPRRTAFVAQRWEELGVRVTWVRVPGERHAMLRRARRWHETVAEFVSGALPLADRPS